MSATPANRCPNCDAPQTSPPTPFCAQCGQESRVRAPTLLQFMQEFGGAYISTEGALWRSLKLLLTRPGALTLDYLRGKRRSYVLPLRLYLTISVLVMAMLRLLSAPMVSPEREDAMAKSIDSGTFFLVNIGSFEAGVQRGNYFCRGLPDWYCERLRAKLKADPHSAVRSLNEGAQRAQGHMGQALFVLLPLFALGLQLLFWGRAPRGLPTPLHYTEHLVFALHLHACWFVCLALVLLPLPFAGIISLIAGLAYAGLSLRQVYGGAWWALVWRSTLLLLLHAVALFAALIFALLWGVIA